MPHSDDRTFSRRGSRRRRRIRKRVLRVLLVAAAAVVVVLAFTAYQAVKARSAMLTAADRLTTMSDRAAAGDPGAARQAMFDAQAATVSAQRNTSGPVWWLASKLPLIGDDVTAVRTVIDVADNVTQGILPDLIDASEALAPADLQPKGGRINLAGIRDVAPALAAANDRLGVQLQQAQAIDTSSLMSRVAAPVAELQTKLADAHTVTERVSLAAQLLPTMLGGEQQQRTYLVMFQNNAEVRAGGGIPGAMAVVQAKNGRVSLTRQASLSDLSAFGVPVVPLSKSEEDLFGRNLGQYPADVTFTPDFERSAELLREMWLRDTGQAVDGVVSVDPVAMSYLLNATGPVTLADGTKLTAANAVDYLLHDVYMTEPDPDRQNAIFADAASKVFAALTTSQGDAQALFDGLLKGAQEHRIRVWSADEAERNLLATTPLAGRMPTEATSTPQLGVYLNDGTGAKMDYYLKYGVDVAPQSCAADGSQTLKVTITLKSTAPSDAAALPESVIGPGYRREAWGDPDERAAVRAVRRQGQQAAVRRQEVVLRPL